MDVKKLHEVIKEKNEQRERHALRQAEDIIQEIVSLIQTNDKNDKKIAELRKELSDLEVVQIDPKTVLGV